MLALLPLLVSVLLHNHKVSIGSPAHSCQLAHGTPIRYTCRFFTGIDVSVRHLTFVERVAFSKHKLSLSLPADDNTIGRLLLILDVGANAGLNKDEVLLAIGSVSS